MTPLESAVQVLGSATDCYSSRKTAMIVQAFLKAVAESEDAARKVQGFSEASWGAFPEAERKAIRERVKAYAEGFGRLCGDEL